MAKALVKVPAIFPAGGLLSIRHSTEFTRREEPKKKVKRKKRRKAKGKKRWFSSKVESGWKKTQPAGTRRRLLLKAHKGSLLSAARSKQALANVTQDEETKEIALADARFFFEEHRKSKKER